VLGHAEPTGRYRTIVADPPWEMPSGGRRGGPKSRWQNHRHPPHWLPYRTLPLADVCALPVSNLAERDAHLYLWIPNAQLEHAWQVCRAWGFEPSSVLIWCKTPRGLGLGGAYTKTAEFLIFARRGSLKALRRSDTSWFHWKRPHNNHSAKPEAALDLVESMSPGPYLELFARRQRLGWDTWGNEALEHVTLAR
jgi:N6-adenosine-specific RNA methylase IME4